MRPLARYLSMVCLVGVAVPAALAAAGGAFEEQNRALLTRLQEVHGLTEAQMAQVRQIFDRSGFIGQGNPAISEHPADPQDCRAMLRTRGVGYEEPAFQRICGAPYMAPLYDPTTQRPEDAKACIDQFEFPDIPCEYPVVWVRAREAALLCEAVGKRLCDAHEWEGACAGALEPPDYRFDLARGASPNAAIARRASAHNAKHGPHKAWSYGPTYEEGVCAAGSRKSPGCQGGGWTKCGSNTYPAGYFTRCKSALGVYDLNGNAAEHMNLPLDETEMASRGSGDLGYTEMKGSWFIFDSYRAHPDWCRWRAPFWHGSRVMDAHSHANYHLGFRCCKSLGRD